MRRMLWGLIFALLFAAAGVAVAWKLGLGESAMPPGPPIVAALQAHLRADGIDTRAGEVKNRSANATARIMFELRDGADRRFQIYVARDADAARRELDDLRRIEPQARPEVNGVLVLFMPDTAADPQLERVRRSFRSFSGAGG